MVDPNKTFELTVPLDIAGEKYAKVTLRRPKGREIRALRNASAKGDPVGDLTVKMMADLAEVEEIVFDEMDGADFRTVESWLEGLLGN